MTFEARPGADLIHEHQVGAPHPVRRCPQQQHQQVAAAGEATCRALFLNGVLRRFPELRCAFLEGGVGWACNLYADLIGHWEKRGLGGLSHYDPANLDRPLIEALFESHGSERFKKHRDELEVGLRVLSEPQVAVDEFEAAGIERAEALYLRLRGA